MTRTLPPIGAEKPITREGCPAIEPPNVASSPIGVERPLQFVLPDSGNFGRMTSIDDVFRSGFPMPRKDLPLRPVITPKLQADFSQFLSKYDLTKEQTFIVPVDGGKIRLEISVRPSDKQIMVWVFANGKEGALATLTANGKGKLTDLSEVGLPIANQTRETVALYYDQSPSLPMKDALIESFHIPPVTDELRAKEAEASAARTAHEARLATVKPTKTQTRRVTTDNPNSIEVLQHEYSITRPGGERSAYLQTFGAGPCVVLTLYDKSTKTGLLAHLDATTNVTGSFSSMIAHLQRQGVKIENLEARIVGGQTGQSEELILQLRDQLGERTIGIVEQDIIESRDDVSAVVLDTNTGELYDYTETQLTRSRADFDMAVMNVMSLQGQRLSFHRSNLGLK